MKEELKNTFEKIRLVKDKIFQPKFIRGLRITYSVIWNLILIFLICLLLVVSFGFGAGAGYFASLVKDEIPRSYESMRRDIYNYEEPSEVFFAGNVPMGKLRSDIIREEIPLEEVSQYVIDAVIATEDQNFYEHKGVVPKSTLRALLQTFTNAPTQTGGSTLTQQLVKNQILTNEVSFERKAKEILLALRLERFFSKEEILEAYLNVSSFGRNSSGQNIAGVQAAAKGIFGVDAKDLNLPQAAFIAGLPQSPNGYTPFTRSGELKSPEGLKPGLDRQKTVLSRMYEMGFITEEEYKEALEYDIVSDFIPPQPTLIQEYPFLSMEVEERAKQILTKLFYEKDGYTEEDIQNSDVLQQRYRAEAEKAIRQNGYQIHITIDKEIYDKHQEIAKNFSNYAPPLPEEKVDEETGEKKIVEEPMEVGMKLIENHTGRIISFVAGRDYERESTNHTTALRSNGSTMKPLAAYGPAIDLGVIAPGTPIADVDHGRRVNGRPWPQNFSRRYYGLTSARIALAKSYNVSAVNVFDRIINAGYDPYSYLEKMGMESLKTQEYKVPSLPLGSPSVTVEETTNAYATFANEGKFVDAYMIEKIYDKDGNLIYEHQSEPVEVFSPQAAYLTIDMMRDVISSGTAGRLRSYMNFGGDWAGKTGTSQNTHDIWFVGLNPNVTMGIWLGYDSPKTIPRGYTAVHLQLWAQFMNAAHELRPELINPSESFKMPGGIVRRSFCGISGYLPSEACSQAGLVVSDLFIADYVPTKVDNSLILGKFVTIGDKRYLALDSTPDEFAQTGVMLNPDFVKEIAPNLTDLRQLIPDNSRWSNILIPNDRIEENGKVPAGIPITLSNNVIRWNQHPEGDVIGYRIYRLTDGKKGAKVGSVLAGSSLSFTLPGPGEYALTAVDIAGNESPLSNVVTYGIVEVPEIPDIPGDEPGDFPPPDDGMPGDENSGANGGNKDEPDHEDPDTDE